MKRIFSCLLALVLLLALVPAVTSMATGEGDLYYNLDADGNAAITDYTGAGGPLQFPQRLTATPSRRFGIMLSTAMIPLQALRFQTA